MAYNIHRDNEASSTQSAWLMGTPRFSGNGQVFEEFTMQQAQSQQFMNWTTGTNEDIGTATLNADMQGLPMHIRRGVATLGTRQAPNSLRRDAMSRNGFHGPGFGAHGLEEAIPAHAPGTESTDYFTALANWDQRPSAELDSESADRNESGLTSHSRAVNSVHAGYKKDAISTATASGLDPIAAFELYNTLIPQNQSTTAGPSPVAIPAPYLGPFGIPSFSSLRPNQLTRPVLRWYCKTGAIHLCACAKKYRHCRDLYRHIAHRGGDHKIAASTPEAIWVCPLCVRFQRAEVSILLHHMEEEHGVDFTDA